MRGLAMQARGHLERALDSQASLPRAYLLLGRGNCLLGNYQHAIRAYVAYSALRPDNPLGHLELGFAYEALDEKKMAVDAWKMGGATEENFFKAAEQFRKAGQYQGAFQLYEWVKWFSTEDGSIWHKMGLAYEEMEHWELALDAYQQGSEKKQFRGPGLSSLYYRMGRIYNERLSVPQLGRARLAFETALAKDDFIKVWEEADTHYRLGTILRREDADYDEIIEKFELAISIYPQHANARVLYGRTYYTLHLDVNAAETEILYALEIDPQNKWGYFHLGEIYRQEGEIDKAIDMYKQALELDPNFERVREILQNLQQE